MPLEGSDVIVIKRGDYFGAGWATVNVITIVRGCNGVLTYYSAIEVACVTFRGRTYQEIPPCNLVPFVQWIDMEDGSVVHIDMQLG